MMDCDMFKEMFMACNWCGSTHHKSHMCHHKPCVEKEPAAAVHCVQLKKQEDSSPVSENISLRSRADILKAQKADYQLRRLKAAVQVGCEGKASLKGDLRAFKPKFHLLALSSDGLLVYGRGESQIPVMPQFNVRKLASEMHKSLGHAGRNKTT